MDIELDSVVTQSENYNLEDLDGDMLLYNLESSSTLHFNTSAAIIWQLCDGERSVGDIVGLIQESIPDTGDDLERDVLAAVEEMIRNGALRTT
jgi:hypothetical protein